MRITYLILLLSMSLLMVDRTQLRKPAGTKAHDFTSIEGLRSYVEQEGIHSPEDFIAKLPMTFREHWVLAPNSGSVQVGYLPGHPRNKTGEMLPRVLMMGRGQGDATVVLSYSIDQGGRLDEDGKDINKNHFHSIEVDIRKGAARNVEFHELTFENGELHTLTDRPNDKNNSNACTTCHTDYLAHNWEPGHPSYLPTSEDAWKEQSWIAQWRARIGRDCESKTNCPEWKQKAYDRIKPLAIPSRSNSEAFLHQFIADAGLYLSAAIRQRKDYEQIKPAMLAATLGCEDPPLLPLNSAKALSAAENVKPEALDYAQAQLKRREKLDRSLAPLGFPSRPELTFEVALGTPAWKLRMRIAKSLTRFLVSLGDERASIMQLTFADSLPVLAPQTLLGSKLETLIRAFWSFEIKTESKFDSTFNSMFQDFERGKIFEDDNPWLASLCKDLRK